MIHSGKEIRTALFCSERLRIVLSGTVQGVGFRPAVYRLAQRMHLAGWVRHSNEGLTIEVEGGPVQLAHFLSKLEAERPPAAVVTSGEVLRMPPAGYVWFEILPSDEDVDRTGAPLPNLSTCPESQAPTPDGRGSLGPKVPTGGSTI